MRTQLLCTFSNKRDYERDLIQITSTYRLTFNNIYILENVDNDFQLYLTYNIDVSSRKEFLLKTISVHRKKATNTLYTINALNELVMNETDGVKDDSHEVHWDNYKNTIILTGEDDLRFIKTKLFKIIEI